MFENKQSIKKKVMKIINEKIDVAQKEHDDALRVLDEEHTKAIEKLEADKKAAEIKMLDEQVEKIIGKLM